MKQTVRIAGARAGRGLALAVATAAAAAAGAGCRRSSPPSSPGPSRSAFYASSFRKTPAVAAMTTLGRTLFSAPELSGSGKLACAGCHHPQRAFGPDNDLPVQLGGPDGHAAGLRAVPSLRYLQVAPRFDEHYQDPDGDGADQGPAGGYTWDGRAQTVHDQARLPLFSPLEMANHSPDELVARLRRSRLAAPLRDTFGDDVLDATEPAMKAVLLALEVFQQSAPDFHPYDSKYDAWLRREAQLTEQEARGLRLFNDPAKGNCAACHPSTIKAGAFPQFTDYGFIALGVPRNPVIPANADPGYFDLGLCGPMRTDLAGRRDYCGMFRTPSLRNVTLRRRFFHNGGFHSLVDVVRFYASRDSRPERWYPRGPDGAPRKFDDLPSQYHANVNMDPPFGRGRADGPALTDAEIDDIVAFLGTLVDGYRGP